MYLEVVADDSRSAKPSAARKKAVANGLEIRMFYVDEGECVLIVFPNKDCWIADCGSSTRKTDNEALAEKLIAYLEKNGLLLKVIVPSHPHSDHARAIAHLIRLPTNNIANPVKIYRSDDVGWNGTAAWLGPYRTAVSSFADEVVIQNDTKRKVHVGTGINVHLFAASGKARKNYRSLFMQLRFRKAKVLFTGDSYKRYERAILKQFGKSSLEADVLKVTHHGSDGGTDAGVLAEIRPGMAIASTAADDDHGLDPATRVALGSRGIRIVETARTASEAFEPKDVVLNTDGEAIGGGILYRQRRLAPKLK